MKKLILTLTIVLLPLTLFSQESILDKIAQETCKYIESEEVKNIDVDRRNEKLGLFIINLYNQYEEELLKEGFDINFSDGSTSGRDFGEKAGMNMVKFCPEVLMAFADGFKDIETKDETYEITGKLIDVKGDEFSTVILKDEEGKTQKFLWLQNFIGSDQLIEMLSKSVKIPKTRIIYKNLECYSPQLKEYIIRKEIIEMIFIE